MIHSNSEWSHWSNKEESRIEMTKYIRENFSDVLGDDVQLLDLPNGLDLIQDKIRARLIQSGLSLEDIPNAA